MNIETILLIQPLKYWQINSASVFHVREEGDTLRLCGKMSSEGVNHEEKLTFLIKACDSLQEGRLYMDLGAKKFKKAEKFWSEADDTLKNHAIHVAGIRLNDCIKRASELNMPIFYREKNSDDIFRESAMALSDTEIKPIMTFEGDNGNINYSLTLSLDDKVIVPCKEKINILAFLPGLLGIGNFIHPMSEGFNAKLLLPFISKATIVIPERMKDEFFRKFLIKNATKADITASNIDMEERKMDGKCLVCLERCFGSKASLTLRYRYNTNTYEQEDKKIASINIIDSEEGVKLVRTRRNFAWEESCRNYFFAVYDKWRLDGNNMPSSTTIFNSMEDAVKCLTIFCNKISEDEDVKEMFTIEQNLQSRYFISSYKLQKSKTWIGDWLNIRIALVINDGTKIPFSYFREAIITGQHEIELPNGEVFIIPTEWFATYGGLLMMASVNGDFFKVHRSQLNSLSEEIYNIEENKDAPVVFDDNANTPVSLKATLRPYQEEGLKWLYRNLLAKTGCCLADDMGLGKTIQTIALLLKYKEDAKDAEKNTAVRSSNKSNGMVDMFADFFDNGDSTSNNSSINFKTSLIVCPSSLVHNWMNEIRRFAPSLSVCNYTGSINERRKKVDNLPLWDVVITSYRTAANDISDLSHIPFGVTVFDESQVFKNRSSQLYSSMKQLHSDQSIALSGTPMENSLEELWSLMSVLNPLLLGDYKTFNKNFATPINENLADIRTDILRKTIAPYFLRRTKQQVLSDLPERQDEIVMCEMTEGQHSIYEKEMSAVRNMVTSENANEMSILAAIGRLRQIANHQGMLPEHRNNNDKNVSIDISGKTSAIFIYLDALRGSTHKVLLFSEYVSFLQIIADEMDRREWKYEMLTGESQNREQIINRFNSNSDIQFFLVSLKAGGVGLNLTSADYVFLLNPWWNKAAEEQAISRAHRIGQTRSVFVYRFVTQGTLEEKMLQLQEHKQSLIESVMPFLSNG